MKMKELIFHKIRCVSNRRGNAFIEYFVLALIVLAATVWFFDGGNYRGVQQSANDAATNMITEIAKPQ